MGLVDLDAVFQVLAILISPSTTELFETRESEIT